ncbi:hypothetical protein [Pedobacter faecalis]|uniref:hypothetical protein n=1 Tax=Pedobacter faecalis TaxID=3041495 RepID=UPI00254E0FE0|nr:hypothetical protein [Pedobacter sp. ELA7]
MVAKKFRQNLVVVYMTNPANFQIPIQNIIRHLAWLYHLEYSIVDGNEVFPEGAVDRPCDMIYLRSTKHTSITSKGFQQLVNSMFDQGALFGCVDIFFQLQKKLKDYPFPNVFIRPLNYPYSNVYNGREGKLYIDPQALKDLNVEDSFVN